MNERRREPRSRSLLSGIILFNDRNSVLDCVLKNVSAGGALVVLPPESPTPREFDLRVPRRDEERHATVVWRRNGSVGLALAVAQDTPAGSGTAPKRRWLQGRARPAHKPTISGY